MYTGKQVYSAGQNIPGTSECLADLVGLVSPYETPLLDVLGDPIRGAVTTHHEWLEGEEKERHGNYTQVFTSPVEVKETDLAATQLGLSDEMDYQKQERLRELLRDLENAIINGGIEVKNKPVQRIMHGIIPQMKTNVDKYVNAEISEDIINKALKHIWENSAGNVDLIVVGGYQKRALNSILTKDSGTEAGVYTYRDMVSKYESDFGLCNIVATRWMPQDSVLFLDSSRVNVLPLSGRSFHYDTLANGDGYECGEVVGEYTLELKNETSHGIIRGLKHE